MDQKEENAPPAEEGSEHEPPHVMCRKRWDRIEAEAKKKQQ